MAETAMRRGGRRRRFALAALVVVAVALWLVFKLYEPFIVGPFEPLGMKASHAATGRPEQGDAVFYDTSRPGLFKEVFRVENTNKLPSGGLLSAPSDLARLGYQMIQPTLFDEETRDLLLPAGDAPPFYGLGWRYQVETEFLGGTTPRMHHHGTALGSTSHFTVYPEYGMVVSVMMNAGQLPSRGLESHAHALAENFAAELESDAGLRPR